MINYDLSSGVDVVVTPVRNKELKSVLSIRGLTGIHSGKYSCSPSQVSQDSVTVRVKHKEVGDPEPVVNCASQFMVIVLLVLITVLEF